MFEKAKIRFHDLKNAVKGEKDAVNDINELASDLQVQLKKLDFKNKPHLDRIDEAQTRITETLAAFPKNKK